MLKELREKFRRLITRTVTHKTVTPNYNYKPMEIGDTEIEYAFSDWSEGRYERMFTLFDLILRRDSHIQSVVNTRLYSHQLPFTFESPVENDPRVTFLQENLTPKLSDWIGILSMAFMRGLTVLQISWDTSDAWVISDLTPIPVQNYKLWKNDIVLVTTEGYVETIRNLSEYTQVPFIPRTVDGKPAGSLQACINWYNFKTFCANNWASFTEVFGMPIRVGRYKRGSSQQEQDALYDMVQNLGTDASAVIPEDTMVEFIETKVRRGSVIYKDLIDSANQEISKAILGQTLTTETSRHGNYATAKIHDNVRMDYLRNDLRILAQWIDTHIIAPMIRFNFADTSNIPTVTFDMDVIRDPLNFLRGLEIAHRIGKTIHPADFRKAGLTTADDEEPIPGGAGKFSLV